MGHLVSFKPCFLHLLLSLLFLATLPFSLSEIKKIRIVSDSRPLILFEQFGYSRGGHAVVSVHGVSWKPPPHPNAPDVDLSKMGFFLVRAALFDSVANESEHFAGAGHFCLISSRFVTHILKFQDLKANSTLTRADVVVDNPDEYSLLFGSCSAGVEVTMDVRTEMYNMDGGAKDYLPLGRKPLPKFYFTFSVVYAAFLVAWIAICVKQRATVDKIHIMMAALLLFKGLKMVCAAEDLSFVKRTGTPHGWDVAFYVFGFFKGVLLFTVIVLIGTGWSFLKPYLQDREKNVLKIVIPMQVLENIASVVIGETGPSTKDWLKWNQIFLMVDIICCCAVFFPIVWSIRSLREASKSDGKAARNLEKLNLFKQFYLVVVCYLYFTRIVLPSFAKMLDYRYHWCAYAAEEGVSFAFYVIVFHNFRPVEKNPYLFVGEEEEEAAAGVLEMETAFEL
ncbi:hypothetical protein Cni_G08889 [Canna indica]|uniref:Protein GPR107 n=1 Tax=Canna indica TaxID=4628 RepID=A0AAQ3K711_9LILI|nr:hypothetical protein Cni_G08889 [Canna indica]